jgi:hypothetical protein
VSGYVRPRLTDQQAQLQQLLLDRELADPRKPLFELGMLGRAQAAIDRAFDAREERREERQAREAAKQSRRQLLGWFRRSS